jgi:YVTN family beta-propeller protein
MKIHTSGLALGLALLTSASASVAAEYQILARYPVGGEKWSHDYVRVDPTARRIYVAHEKQFEVLDADTGKKVGVIAPATRAHGVAIASGTGHGFATSGIDDQITMFDTNTLATLKQFKSPGTNPDAIEYDPDTKKIYVGNHGGGGVTVIDPVSGDVVANIAIDGKLEAFAFDGRGQGFVNIEDKSAIGVFDTHTLKPKAVWSSAPGEGGTGLACDAAHHRLFSACGNNKVAVLNSDTGKVVATPACGEDPDGLVFDPKTNRIFTSNPDGTMTVIQEDSPDKYTLRETAKTEVGCRTLALDEKTGHLVTAAPKYGPAPAPVKGGGRPRPVVLPDSFQVFIVGTK